MHSKLTTGLEERWKCTTYRIYYIPVDEDEEVVFCVYYYTLKEAMEELKDILKEDDVKSARIIRTRSISEQVTI